MRAEGPGHVKGRVGADGRLLAADGPLAAMQEEAGARIGSTLAIPQVAAVARLARRLSVPVSRAATAALGDDDIQLWIEATPQPGGDVELSISGWQRRPARSPMVAPGRASHAVALGDLAAQEAAEGGVLEWQCDAGLVVTAASPSFEQALGIAQGDARGRALTQLVRLQPDEDGHLPLLEALSAREPFEGQDVTARQSGTPLRLQAKPEFDSEGSLIGYRGQARAVGQDDGRDEGEAVHSPAGLVAEIDTALHDALSSPLDKIIAAADRIVSRADGPLRTDYASYASDIAAAGRHLLSVIQSMTEREGQAAVGVDVVAIAQEAAGMAQAAADRREVEIVLDEDVGDECSDAQGQPRAILQILVNMIGNAVRHSPDGGTVAVVFGATERDVRVTVADQGPGIARADQSRIFERFEQGGSAPGSAGLGLAISRRLARSMGGDIELDSAPGEGARFTLILPKG